MESKPELQPQLTKLYRRGVGRPRIEEQCPDLLQIIEEIAKVGGASDDRRRSETIRPCLTLDDLREKIKQPFEALLAPKIHRLNDILKPGLVSITWSSLTIDQFVNTVR